LRPSLLALIVVVSPPLMGSKKVYSATSDMIDVGFRVITLAGQYIVLEDS